jgi:hypothetical protein
MTAPAQTLSSCARATSAAELRHRIDRPIRPARAARIIALDDAAAGVLSRIADRPWANARFYLCEPAENPEVLRAADASAGQLPELPESARHAALREIGGPSFALAAELSGTDVVVVVATDDTGREYAAAVGRVCAARAIMTAGVVLGAGPRPDSPENTAEAADAVAALRPYARVLLPTADEGDLVELLTALRV